MELPVAMVIEFKTMAESYWQPITHHPGNWNGGAIDMFPW